MRCCFALAALLAPCNALDEAAQRCLICAHSINVLHHSLTKEKKELETAKAFTDEKAKKVDKVQKAQTKRWLKNEYGVALRARLEDVLGELCSYELMASNGLTAGCGSFVDEYEEELPRAVLDGKHEEFCESTLPDDGPPCDAAAVAAATAEAEAKGRKLKSEPKPKKGKAQVGSKLGERARVPLGPYSLARGRALSPPCLPPLTPPSLPRSCAVAA